MSNLIEQLGGYEKAKGIFNNCPQHYHEYQLNNIGPYKAGYYRDAYKNRVSMIKLKKALLEHRRANNIFEVGDYVLPNSNYSDQVHFLSEWYIDGLDFRYKTSSGGWGIIVKSCMGNAWRHATDEEITAGHRLP